MSPIVRQGLLLVFGLLYFVHAEQSPPETTEQQPLHILVNYAADIHYDSIARIALQALSEQYPVVHDLSRTIGHTDAFCLTLCGAKGGQPINQDRALTASGGDWFRLASVLDGHGTDGHHVSEFGRGELVRRIEQEVVAWQSLRPSQEAIVEYLEQLPPQIDAAIPPRASAKGGATFTSAWQIHDTIYLVNAGDSQSLVGATTPHGSVVLQTTRLDKPDVERQRLLAAGAQSVTDESDEDASRVWNTWIDDDGEEQSIGLAMSRGIGDRHAKGVIADPLVQMWTVEELLEQAVKLLEKMPGEQVCEITADGEESCSTPEQSPPVDKQDLRLFAVSATDGLIDYVEPNDIARVLGGSIGSTEVFLAAQELIYTASQGWDEAYGGKYRDDIALSFFEIVR